MALEIEDGTGSNPAADSYATAAELADRAAAYGWTIPTVVADQESLLRRAAEQMDGMKWKGSRTSATQPLAWPRSGVVVDDVTIPSDTIPARVQYGQMALAAELYGNDLNPPDQQKGAVIEERIEGAVDVKYAELKNTGFVTFAKPDRPSAIQFSYYLQPRPLTIMAVRA
jgi:hypothetical protein